MPTIPDTVGLEVLEAMRGEVTRTGSSTREAFTFSTTQVITSLNRFRKGKDEDGSTVGHLCQARGGVVTWNEGSLTRRYAITGGTIEMYRDVPSGGGRYKQFEFNLEFTGPGGAPCLLKGFKELLADGPIQILDALKDLSTLRHVTISNRATHEVLATGELHVGLEDLVQQMGSLRFPGATAGQVGRARQDFLGFMNGKIAAVYPGVPQFFRESRSLLWQQHLLVNLLIDVFVTGPKAVKAPDVIAQLETYLANLDVDMVQNFEALIRAAEQFLGQAIAQADPVEVRAALRTMLQRPVTNDTEKGLHDIARQVHLVVVAAYYACAGADAEIGYTRSKTNTGKPTNKLPVKRRPANKEYDVVVIGSGVGGSIVAHRLATEQGLSVCVLEAGRYHHERSFSSDEIDGLSRVYEKGGMQTATDPGWKKLPSHQHREITVLQASAVGGGGLINNAVCFRLPKARFDAWRNVGFPVTEAELNGAYDAVAQQLGIIPASQATGDAARLNPMVKRFKKAWGAPGQHDAGLPNVPGFYECNVNMGKKKCTGCGYCNLACSFEAKRNSLQVHLAEAVATKNVDIVPLARVHALELDGRTVKAASVMIEDELVRVRGKQFVVAAGPLHSSALLMRSKLHTRGVPGSALIGRRLSANIGAPVLAFTNDRLDSFGKLQIAHFYLPPDAPGFAIESWFNAPAAQAMVVPGYFEDHRYRMQSYAHLGVAAPLVGTFPGGSVDASGKLTLPLMNSDLARVHAGHLAIAEALFADAGAIDHLVMPTEQGVSIYERNDLRRYAALDDLRSLVVGTGHPQGGNGMSRDPQIGPVDEDFLVRGTANLRVADGSLFPDCASINPQWTIMALAHLCAGKMMA